MEGDRAAEPFGNEGFEDLAQKKAMVAWAGPVGIDRLPSSSTS